MNIIINRTNKIVIYIFIFILLTVKLVSNSEIKFEKKTISFGTYESGKIVNVEFKFENIGKKTLKIIKIITECGCTLVKLHKKKYLPGEIGVIPIIFNSKELDGKINKKIIVYTNTKDKIIKLNITGDIFFKDIAKLDIPKIIDFQTVKAGDTYIKKIRVKNIGSCFAKIKGFWHSPDLYPEIGKTLLNINEETELILKFIPKGNSRKYHTRFKIIISPSKRKIIYIKLFANIIQ